MAKYGMVFWSPIQKCIRPKQHLNFDGGLRNCGEILLETTCKRYYGTETYATHADKISFIPPNITQFIKLCEGAEVGIFVEPLDLDQRDLILQAVNDNDSFESAGGSHWSLLVYHRASGLFRHYDSMSSGNGSHAKTIARKMCPFLPDCKELQFTDVTCSQQTNGSDCGVYVIGFAEEVCKSYDNGSYSDQAEWNITPQSINCRREDLKQIIHTLATKTPS